MGRAPCCDKANVKRGPWSPEEDATLKNYVQTHGIGGNWIALPLKAGLKRCGKSCRLRWLNYLRPDIKHGGFTEEEDNVICSLYCQMGSRWSLIASQLPGRTDNDVKNYWNTKLKKKLLAGKSSSFNNGGFGFLPSQQQQQQPETSLLCLPKIETNYNISTPMLGYGFSVSSSSTSTSQSLALDNPIMSFSCPDKITHLSQSGPNLDTSHNNIVVVSSQEGSGMSNTTTTGNGYGEDTGNIILMDDIIDHQQLSAYDQFPYYEFVNGEIVNLPSCFDFADIKPT